MSSSRRARSASASPVRGHRSRSSSRYRRSRSRSQDSAQAENPGNNLYVTGLSTRITDSDLQKYFSKEGKVVDCGVVKDPRTKESRGFGFVTMETNDDAERCIKYLNRTVFEGRLITVEKARRSRGRTPTPGKYSGPRDYSGHGGRRFRSYSPKRRRDRDHYSRDRRHHYSKDQRHHHSRDRRRRSGSPYSRRVEDYSDKYKRPRD